MNSDLPIQWSDNALDDLKRFEPKDFGGVDPKAHHEQKVRDYYDTHKATYPGTVKAKIIRGYHVGGTDPKEKEHITASFKNSRSKDIGDAVHIYRHDDAKDTD